MISFRLNLFFKEFILFGSTLLLSIFLAYSYVPYVSVGSIETISFSWRQAIFFLGFFSLASYLAYRSRNFNKIFLRLFLVLVVFSGSQAAFDLALDFPNNFLAALAMVALFHFFSNVFFHNLGMILGLAGISSILGISFDPNLLIFFLVALSFYDILAVYWTKHMVYMAKGMIESGAIFGFIIPFSLSDIFLRNEEVRLKIGERFMILGSGDIGLPAIFVSSIAFYSIQQALFVFVFSALGLFSTHLIFVNQRESRPMAALPPIATLTIIGYLVSTFWW